MKVKLGPIALQYAGSGQFLERDDTAHRAVIEAKGKDKRGNGTAGATVTVQLAPVRARAPAIDVTTDLSITGKPAQFGRGVMQDVSDKLLQQFVACIERQFAPEAVEPEPASSRPRPRLRRVGAAARAARPPPEPAAGVRGGRHPRPRPRRSVRAGGAATAAGSPPAPAGTTRSTSAPRCSRCSSRATRRTPWRPWPGWLLGWLLGRRG